MATSKRKRNYSPEFREMLRERMRRINAQSKADLEAGRIARYPGGRRKKPPEALAAAIERADDRARALTDRSSSRRAEDPEPAIGRGVDPFRKAAAEERRRLGLDDEAPVVLVRNRSDGSFSPAPSPGARVSRSGLVSVLYRGSVRVDVPRFY